MTEPVSIIQQFLKRNPELKRYMDSLSCICGRKIVPLSHHESKVQSDGGVSSKYPVGITCKDCECGQPGISLYSRKGK